MLLYFFITCFSFIFFAKSLPLKPLPPWASEMRLLPLCFWKDLFLFSSIRNFLSQVFRVVKAHSRVSMIRSLSLNYAKIDKNVNDESGEGGGLSLLDLPELALDNILEKLPPEGLCTMSAVCASLRERCTSDHLWERHMKQKWGRVIGPAAYREWQWYRASRKDSGSFKENKINGFKRLVSMFWPSCWVSPKVDNIRASISLPVNSIMSCYPCYLALETGKFWFPAQVYNRENGHVGFMLSCYDAELSYDPCTDAFEARYPPHGRRPVAMESSVPWERLRAAPIDNSPHDLYSSDCLNDLLPGDHIEIQWRKNKEFPYGWWYGVVGHLESCDGNEHFCQCHNSDSVVLEFRQYAPGSRWRRTTVSRKDHQEEGDERDGFYGGIRKLYNNEEIAKWRQLWPAEILE